MELSFLRAHSLELFFFARKLNTGFFAFMNGLILQVFEFLLDLLDLCLQSAVLMHENCV